MKDSTFPLEKEKTCCFTGHRTLPRDPSLLPHLEQTIRDLAAKGVTCFCAGGARGFDTLAARTVLRLKAIENLAISLVLILPYPEQAVHWSRQNIAAYEAIKENADQVIYVSPAYDFTCMQRRNRRLVDVSSHCICYLRSETGGTAYTVRYAKEQGLSLLLL